MKVFLGLALCFVVALCERYDEMQHTSEECEPGTAVPHCFATPCQIETECKKFPDAVCSNNYCRPTPCTTVWRHNGKEIDCGNYD